MVEVIWAGWENKFTYNDRGPDFKNCLITGTGADTYTALSEKRESRKDHPWYASSPSADSVLTCEDLIYRGFEPGTALGRYQFELQPESWRELAAIAVPMSPTRKELSEVSAQYLREKFIDPRLEEEYDFTDADLAFDYTGADGSIPDIEIHPLIDVLRRDDLVVAIRAQGDESLEKVRTGRDVLTSSVTEVVEDVLNSNKDVY